MNKLRIILQIFLVALATFQISASDGLWLPNQLQQKDIFQLFKKNGLKLSASQIYTANKACISGTILSISVGDNEFSPFATASFISSKGLVLTNSHCVAQYISQLSSPQNDYLKYGCWATRLEEETYLPNLQLNQLMGIRDVTDSILIGSNGLSGNTFIECINRNSKRLIEQMPQQSNIRYKIYSMHGGRQYLMLSVRVFSDVRIVAMPPISIAKFGGDTDNWQWPRYSADFAILRVYANRDNNPSKYHRDNRPYQTDNYLHITTKGIRENDFVMLGGYPASTRLYVPSFALERIVFHDLKLSTDIARLKLDYYNNRAENVDSLSSYYKVLAGKVTNIYLRDKGHIEGLRKSNILQQKQTDETALTTWLQSDSSRIRLYGDSLLARMENNYNLLTQLNRADILFNQIVLNGANIIPFAGKFEKLMVIAESTRKNAGVAMNNEIKRLHGIVTDYYNNANANDNQFLFTRLVTFYIQHAQNEFIPNPLKSYIGLKTQRILSALDSIYVCSVLTDKIRLRQLLDHFSEGGNQILANDGLYQISISMYRMYVNQINPLRKYYQQKNQNLYSNYLNAFAEMNRTTIYPYDANHTLRFSSGHVVPAHPEEGIIYSSSTTLRGMLERYTQYEGNDDFVLPSQFRSLAISMPDTPCCFLTNALTSSGSSGSPVLNSKGELVGLNFDRIWQSLSSDYRSDPQINCQIAVDIRYILWVLQHYSHSQYILSELDIRN